MRGTGFYIFVWFPRMPIWNYFIIYFLICLFQGGIGHKDVSITDTYALTVSLKLIRSYAYIMFRLHKFDSQ